MRRLQFLLILLLLPAPLAAQPQQAAEPQKAIGPKAAPVPASDLLIRRSGPGFSWRWRMAPEAAQHRPLLAQMRSEALADALKARRDADAESAAAKAAGYPFRGHEHAHDWSMTADTSRLLALAGRHYAYTGGAHGNTGYQARLWDKQSRRLIRFEELFTDWPAARKLLEPAFCTALAMERQGRFPDQPAGTCPDVAALPMMPYGDLAPVARQWRVLVAPYVAGAYAEGSYLITLAWPNGISALVQPRYRADLGLE
jgi:hypothetical protein